MQPCKILIADDEMLARQAIRLALPPSFTACIVAECRDGDEAAAKILQHLPDIIFLDIHMPAKTGLEVLQSLPSQYYPCLIIVSAHDDYALEAYEYAASDYLLKPFTQQRFDKAFQKALRQVQLSQAGKAGNNSLPFAQRVGYVLEGNTPKKRITVRDGARTIIVPCEEVLFLEASGDYVAINTARKKYLYSGSLTGLENSLDRSVFVRTHRSFIVNVNFIKELNSHYNGDYTVLLTNGATVRLSRNYREQLMQQIS